MTIAKDGTVSAIPAGQAASTIATVGRLKLVNPPEADLVKGGDGLFRLNSGVPAPADANVVLTQKALESSNVNAVDALVNMISLARQYDMQIKLLQNAESNSRQAAQIMTMT